MFTIEDSIRAFLSDVREGIRAQQISKGIMASGQSSDSLTINSSESSGSLEGSETFYYQVHGRGPGKMPPIKSMEEWIEIKGHQYNAWALAKNIAKNGTYIFRHPEAGLDIDEIIKEREKAFYDSLSKGISLQILNTIIKN